MARNIKIVLEYDGTRYHGWQIQENSVTVQQKVEEAILKLSGEKRRVVAAGRTDAGVHARGQVANFLLEKDLPLHKVEMGLNAHLPRDIVVKAASEVPIDFNARFSAKKRVYQYYISPVPTAIMRKYCWQFFKKFDPEVLNLLAEKLIGEHDFGAFARLEVQSEHKRCMVYESRWFQEKGLWVYRIVANRFLHGMVRTIIGTMMDVAAGNYSIEEFVAIFQSRNRLKAGPAAPARGLFLEEVVYN